MHEEQAGLQTDQVVGCVRGELFGGAGVVMDAGQREVVGEIDVTGAQQPVELAVGIVRVQAEGGIEFNVFHLAVIGVAERVVKSVDDRGELQRRGERQDGVSLRVAVDRAPHGPLLQAPVGPREGDVVVELPADLQAHSCYDRKGASSL